MTLLKQNFLHYSEVTSKFQTRCDSFFTISIISYISISNKIIGTSNLLLQKENKFLFFVRFEIGDILL